MSKNTNRPTHRIYALTKKGDRTFWNDIGAAWAHRDGEGFNLKLDYLPGTQLVVRKPKANEAEAAPEAETA